MIDSNVLNEKVVNTSAPAGQREAGVQVRATKVGFHGVVRTVGEVFTMPAGSKGSWFVPVEKPTVAKAKGGVLSDADLV